MKVEDILKTIETRMLERQISRSELALMVNRHRSTITKFFNPKSQTRSRILMLEILDKLELPYSIENDNVTLAPAQTNHEQDLFNAWLEAIKRPPLTNGQYHSLKHLLYQFQ